MKTSVLLPLWLFASLTLQAQTTECRTCCGSPDEPDLLRILAYDLAAQCPDCQLLGVSQCTLTDADIDASRAVLRYTLRLPDGTVSTHRTTMTCTGQGWITPLYPPGDPLPACDPGAL
jgi:hypothetical protein